jgi:hypothetical protein
MNPDDNPSGYLGAICIIDESPYYITGETPPTLFKTEDEAKRMIKELSRLRPKVEFQITAIELYLNLMSAPWEHQCKWLKKMRKEYIKQ